jgi:hypothetical protein
MKNDNKTWALKVPTSTRLYVREEAKKAKISISEWVEQKLLESRGSPGYMSNTSNISLDSLSKQVRDLSNIITQHINSTQKKGWFS